jgi:hypothetical protein
VRVLVSFPPIKEMSTELVLETWLPWVQVYGEQEGEESQP